MSLHIVMCVCFMLCFIGIGRLTSCAIPVQVTTLNGYPLANIGCGWAHTGVREREGGLAKT
jgi:hypothetical protein